MRATDHCQFAVAVLPFATLIACLLAAGCAKTEDIFESVEKGDAGRVKRAIWMGADVNGKNDDGASPLHLAALRGNVEIVQVLIENKAEVNAVESSSSWTPLFHAADKGYVEIAELLIDYGADLDINDSSGRTALDVAVEAGQTRIIGILSQHQAE